MTDWRCLSESLKINYADFPKQYGLVRRGDRVFIRNYNRVIKSGLNTIDLMRMSSEKNRQMMRKHVEERLWQT